MFKKKSTATKVPSAETSRIELLTCLWFVQSNQECFSKTSFSSEASIVLRYSTYSRDGYATTSVLDNETIFMAR